MEGTGDDTATGTVGKAKTGRVAKGMAGGWEYTGTGGGGAFLLTCSSAEALEAVSERQESMRSK